MGYTEQSSGNKPGSKKVMDSSDLEELLDFDLYVDDISLLNDEIDDLQSNNEDLELIDNSDTSEEFVPYSNSRYEDDSDITSAFGSEDELEPLTEEGLDEILNRPLSTSESDDDEISLSPEELLNIESGGESDFVDPDTTFDEHFAAQIDDFHDDDDNITLGADELDNILGTTEEPVSVARSEEDLKLKETVTDDDNIVVDLDADTSPKIFALDMDIEEDDENDISLSDQELDNILGSEESTSEDDEISLSGDELSNLLDSGGESAGSEEYGKSFFDSDEEILEEFDNEVVLDEDLNEESSFDDGPIALSSDELSNITGEVEEEEPVNFQSDFDTETSPNWDEQNVFDSEPEDESIALSGDELSNIFDSDEAVEETDMEGSVFDSELEDESIALSGEELNNILGSDDIIEETDIQGSSLFDSELEDESITLSPDELGNLTGEEVVEEEQSIFDENIDEDESITLSLDELGNITGEEDIQTEEVSDIFDSELSGGEDDSITLSPDELGNIIDEGEVIEEAPSDIFDAGDDEISLSGDELNNILESGNLDVEEVDTALDSDEEPIHFETVKRKDMQKLMSYLDEMLGTMPEEFVKDFASSEYFELYKRIMGELDL